MIRLELRVCCIAKEYCAQDRALARERTTGLSMMPLRKIRSMSLASVPDGNSFRLCNTCCMASKNTKENKQVRDLQICKIMFKIIN